MQIKDRNLKSDFWNSVLEWLLKKATCNGACQFACPLVVVGLVDAQPELLPEAHELFLTCLSGCNKGCSWLWDEIERVRKELEMIETTTESLADRLKDLERKSIVNKHLNMLFH